MHTALGIRNGIPKGIGAKGAKPNQHPSVHTKIIRCWHYYTVIASTVPALGVGPQQAPWVQKTNNATTGVATPLLQVCI